MAGAKPFLKENSLSLFFLVIFLAALVGQAISGHSLYNHWQSEYLQFALFAIATVWLLQRGSPESKELDKAGTESDAEQKVGRHAQSGSPRWAAVGGLRTALYSNSLIVIMAIVFVGSWFAQSVTGWTDFNHEQQSHGDPGASWLSYVGSSTFWESTFQNRQSEFLAVGSFAVLTIFLRQRGSPESKPVGAPTEDATGQEGG